MDGSAESSIDRAARGGVKSAFSSFVQDGRGNRQYNGRDITINEAPAGRAETPPSPIHTVPFSRGQAFVHRAELDDIERRLIPGTRLALVGLGGVGKSQLAIEYCYRVREKQKDTWVLWIHASSAARYDEELRKLADDVRIPGRKAQDADVFRLVYDWLLHCRERWVLVLDNVDDADFLFEPAGHSSRLRLEYLPQCERGSVLITSRRQVVGLRIVGDDCLLVIKPDKGHAIAMVNAGLENDPKSEELAIALDCIPLAIAQATAYIKREAPSCTIKEYVKMLLEVDNMKAQPLIEEVAGLRRDLREASNSVLLSWRISFERLFESHNSAAELLSIMSFYNHQSIPKFILTGPESDDWIVGSDKSSISSYIEHLLKAFGFSSRPLTERGQFRDGEEFNRSLTILRDHSFVTIKQDGMTYEIHRLISLATQIWLRGNGHDRYRRLQEYSIKRLADAFPPSEPENWQTCHEILPHAKMMLDVVARSDLVPLGGLFFHLAQFMATQALYIEAEKAARRSLKIFEDALGPKDYYTLQCMHVLASVLTHQHKYAEAKILALRAQREFEDVLGKENVHTPSHANLLGAILEGQHDYQAAQVMYSRVISYRDDNDEQGPEYKAAATMNLAGCLMEQEKYREAEELFSHGLQAYQQLLGPSHPDTLRSMSCLVLCLYMQSRFSEAEVLARESLQGRQDLFWPDVLLSHEYLARVYYEMGEYDLAMREYRQAYTAYVKVHGSAHHLTQECLEIITDLEHRLHATSTRLILDAAETGGQSQTPDIMWSESIPSTTREMQ